LILKQDDPERSFVKFKDGDDLVLLVNNQGGMSALEMGAVVDETLTQLGTFPLPSLLFSSRVILHYSTYSPTTLPAYLVR